MDRKLRNDLRLAVVRCRTELTEDFFHQLEGAFGIYADGRIAEEAALPQLDAAGRRDRRAIVAALGHIAASGTPMAEAIAQFVRESAFSTLNRLTAIKLMEAPERKLVPESVGNGANSRGFRQFTMISPEAVRAEPDGGYRLYLALLCGDIAQEIGVLFDLRAPQGILFPGERALRAVLEQLNAPELAAIWAEDETLGWVYQYFTPKELRDVARKASAAPRNADELAFRNQFYTPRYVVEFLTENTLGRTWYEMRQGETALAEPARCRYLVRRKHPIWLAPGEAAPETFPEDPDFDVEVREYPGERRMWVRPNPAFTGWDTGLITYALTVDAYAYAPAHFGVEPYEIHARVMTHYEETGEWAGTFEELRITLFGEQRAHYMSGGYQDDEEDARMAALNRAICARWDLEVEAIPHRPKRDPRTLRVLDPACGSGHFLLYAFELLLTIYDEAWDDPELGPRLQREYPERAAYAQAVPGLILKHNLHGIDIDLRAVQIAQLALWLRAQRAWAELGLRPAARPTVTRVNIVAAEPLPGERDLLQSFQNGLEQTAVASLVGEIWDGMAGVGEIGSLFKAEEMVRRAVAETKRDYQSGKVFDQITLFAAEAPPKQQRLDLVSDAAFWENAEAAVLAALREYAAATAAATGDRYRRRLFADDAAQGFALLELFDEPFDVVLMNPPFGAVSHGARAYVERQYPKTKADLYAAFVERGLEVLRPRGYLGAITSRTGFFLTSFRKWREEIILAQTRIHAVADLGQGVLDTAMVETAAYVLEMQR